MAVYREYKERILIAEYDLGEAQCAECGYPVGGYFQNRKLVKVDPCTVCGCTRLPDLIDVPVSVEELLQWVKGGNHEVH